jgi:hypothetical protein
VTLPIFANDKENATSKEGAKQSESGRLERHELAV